MALSPDQINELERRGQANVRDLLRSSGAGQGSIVQLRTPGGDPLRSDVEAWLQEKDIARERLDAERYAQLLLWGKIAGIAAIVGALAALIAAFRWW